MAVNAVSIETASGQSWFRIGTAALLFVYFAGYAITDASLLGRDSLWRPTADARVGWLPLQAFSTLGLQLWFGLALAMCVLCAMGIGPRVCAAIAGIVAATNYAGSYLFATANDYFAVLVAASVVAFGTGGTRFQRVIPIGCELCVFGTVLIQALNHVAGLLVAVGSALAIWLGRKKLVWPGFVAVLAVALVAVSAVGWLVTGHVVLAYIALVLVGADAKSEGSARVDGVNSVAVAILLLHAAHSSANVLHAQVASNRTRLLLSAFGLAGPHWRIPTKETIRARFTDGVQSAEYIPQSARETSLLRATLAGERVVNLAIARGLARVHCNSERPGPSNGQILVEAERAELVGWFNCLGPDGVAVAIATPTDSLRRARL